MKNFTRGLIEYSGIEKCNIRNKKNFKQTNLEQTICIPSQKPDMEQIVKVWVQGCVEDYDVVKTPVGTSVEGQTVTGYKLLVCGDVKMKVQYVANEPTQSVHTAHFKFPFCGYLVLPKDFNPNTRINVSVVVEDILSEQLDLRCIYNNITMMIIADIC